MSVGDKIRAMLNNQKIDQAQFSANSIVYTNNTKSLQDEVDEISKQLEEYQKQISSGSAIPGSLVGCGHSHTIPGLSGISQQIFGGFPQYNPLTPEEQKELQDLEHEHARNIKIAKLNVFKDLPREFRQSIINIIMWEEAVEKINTTTQLEPDRLNELKLRQALSPMGVPFFDGAYMGSPGHSSHATMWPPPGVRLPFTMLPEGISKEDLLQAHMDASLEEEISDGQD